MTREELGHWLRLVGAEGIGPKTAAKLLAAFGLPEQILAQAQERLTQWIPLEQAQALLTPSAEHEALLEQTWAWLQAAPTGQFREVLSLADASYPRLLLSLADPPPLICVMGSRAAFTRLIAQEAARDIAMVGSRNATPQRAFAHALAQSGLNIVSGLALGIDGAAHEGALQAQRDMGAGAGVPIAVVGTGLDRVYPKRHLALAHEIAQCGLILSEFMIGTAPRPENFPRRNRIIAALTQGTLVVEAAMESGSLITARQALDSQPAVQRLSSLDQARRQIGGKRP
jgi:DNA processing protein